MALTDELQKLTELRDSGAINESEFAQAKSRVLGTGGASPPAPTAPLAAQPVQVVNRSGGSIAKGLGTLSLCGGVVAFLYGTIADEGGVGSVGMLLALGGLALFVFGRVKDG